MNYYHEKIETDSLIPARIYIGESKGNNCHYPLHWHRNLEFDLVLKGTIIAQINNKRIEVPAGEFFFVNSEDLHETDAIDKNQMNSITILLSYDLLEKYCPNIQSYYFDFTAKEAASSKIKKFILECAEAYEKKEWLYELRISIALMGICHILLTECKYEKKNTYLSRYELKSMINIKRAISYIEENYESDISLRSIAKEIGMSHTYFSRFFKKATGGTFYSYLNKTRLYYAHQQLTNSDISVTELALNNGFSNTKAFIEFFKKVYGTTPGRYKKDYIAKDNN